MNTLWQDIRYAIRMLTKSPGFTAVAVLTLALGIGANTAIFSVVNAVMLRPLPYHQQDRIMAIAESSPQFPEMSVSYLNFQDWKVQNRSFDGMAVFRSEVYNLTGSGAPEHIPGREVSAGLFSLLGMPPALGRDVLPEDNRLGAAPVVILGYSLWQRKFGGDPQIIGKAITLTDRNYTVVGVLPENFWFYRPVDVFVPVGIQKGIWTDNREIRSGCYVVARLKVGVSVTQARADMSQIAGRLAEAYPKANAAHGIVLKPILEDVVGDTRTSLLLLLGAVGFVLLIACVNVANLLLARAAVREKEIAVRAALGASRWRVIRQLLTESVLLAGFGAALGLLFARWGTTTLVTAIPGSLPRTAQGISIDVRVLAFTVLIAFLTGIIFGLAPALRAARTEVHDALKEGARGSTGRRHRLQDLLVVSELALALVLLVCAGLTLRSIILLRQTNPGFNPEKALTFNVSLSPVNYPTPAKMRAYFTELVRRLEATPGVQAASLSTDVPLRDDSEIFFYIAGRPKPTQEQLPWAMFYTVSPGYKDAMDLHLSKGRFFTDQDRENAPEVVVIDEALARGLFSNEDPIGQHMIVPFPGFDQPREIVGVVNHVKHWGLAQDASARIQYQFYMPFVQIPDQFYSELGGGAVSLVVRTSADPRAMTGVVQDAVSSVDKDQPLFGLQTMHDLVQDSLASQRFATLLLGIFAVVALVLAAVGIYGVMSYLVGQRTHEVGIRVALGATRSDVLKLILSHGSLLALLGTLAGLAASFGLTRLLASLLYGVKPTDPLTFAAVAVLLAAIALLACYIPARRATRVDPMIALRYE